MNFVDILNENMQENVVTLSAIWWGGEMMKYRGNFFWSEMVMKLSFLPYLFWEKGIKNINKGKNKIK